MQRTGRPPCGEKKLALGRDIAWRDGESGVRARLPDHRRRDIDPGHGHAAARAKFHAPLPGGYSQGFGGQTGAGHIFGKKRFDECGRWRPQPLSTLQAAAPVVACIGAALLCRSAVSAESGSGMRWMLYCERKRVSLRVGSSFNIAQCRSEDRLMTC